MSHERLNRVRQAVFGRSVRKPEVSQRLRGSLAQPAGAEVGASIAQSAPAAQPMVEIHMPIAQAPAPEVRTSIRRAPRESQADRDARIAKAAAEEAVKQMQPAASGTVFQEKPRKAKKGRRKTDWTALVLATGLAVGAVGGVAVGLELANKTDSGNGKTTDIGGVLPSSSPDATIVLSTPGATEPAVPTQAPGTEAPAVLDTQAPTKEDKSAVGEKIAPGIEFPSTVSQDLLRAFIPNVTVDGTPIPQYQEGELFMPVYRPKTAGNDSHYVGIGPWRLIGLTNISGRAHLKAEDVGLIDIVVDEPGKVVYWVTQLGFNQHQTAVNGNGESDPSWKNQITAHLSPFQEVDVVDRNGRIINFDDGQSGMHLAASDQSDFSIEIPRTDGNTNVIFGLVIDTKASPDGVQQKAIKIQEGPNDEPLTGENLFYKLGKQAIEVPAVPVVDLGRL